LSDVPFSFVDAHVFRRTEQQQQQQQRDFVSVHSGVLVFLCSLLLTRELFCFSALYQKPHTSSFSDEVRPIVRNEARKNGWITKQDQSGAGRPSKRTSELGESPASPLFPF